MAKPEPTPIIRGEDAKRLLKKLGLYNRPKLMIVGGKHPSERDLEHHWKNKILHSYNMFENGPLCEVKAKMIYIHMDNNKVTCKICKRKLIENLVHFRKGKKLMCGSEIIIKDKVTKTYSTSSWDDVTCKECQKSRHINVGMYVMLDEDTIMRIANIDVEDDLVELEGRTSTCFKSMKDLEGCPIGFMTFTQSDELIAKSFETIYHKEMIRDEFIFKEKIIMNTFPHNFGFLIPGKSGIIWEQQTDGVCCHQVGVEGHYIPLRLPKCHEGEKYIDLTEKLQKANYDNRDGDAKEIWYKINKCLEESYGIVYEDISCPNIDLFPSNQEGFKWIKIIKTYPKNPCQDLTPLIGKIVAFIYPNCD